MPTLDSIESALAPLRWNKARVKLLAAVVVALLSAQSINLTKLALLMPTEAKVASAYKRLQRFLADFSPDLDSFAHLLATLCRVAPPWNRDCKMKCAFAREDALPGGSSKGLVIDGKDDEILPGLFT